jgi:hypothetical protein
MKKLITLAVLALSLASCSHYSGCHGGCSSQCDMKSEKCKECCDKKAEQCPMKGDAHADMKKEEVKK